MFSMRLIVLAELFENLANNVLSSMFSSLNSAFIHIIITYSVINIYQFTAREKLKSTEPCLKKKKK